MTTGLTKLQRLMLINAYPVKMILNLAGGGIALFFLWQHELLYSMIFGGVLILGGTLITIKNKTPLTVIARSDLGKVFLRYSTKWGFTCYLFSHVLIPLSFWFHNVYLALTGMALLLAGLIKLRS